MDQSQRGGAGIYIGIAVLIVVAALLWAMAPGFVEASKRARVARCASDLDAIGTALEAYVIDWDRYPPTLWCMTTPIGYVNEALRDESAPAATGAGRAGRALPLYAIFGAEVTSGTALVGRPTWIVAARGPDGVFQLDPARDLPPGVPLSRAEVDRRLRDLTYDPTNGEASAGDIIRFHPAAWSTPPPSVESPGE